MPFTPGPGHITKVGIDHSANARANRDRLPPRAIQKLVKFQNESINEHGRRIAGNVLAEELRQERDGLIVRKNALAHEIERSNTLPRKRHVDEKTGEVSWVPDSDWAKPFDDRIAEINAKREELLTPQHSENSEARCLEWLGTAMGDFVDADLPEVVLPSGQTIQFLVKQARKTTDAAKALRLKVERAPRTKAEARAKLLKELARLARKGRPLVSPLFRGGHIDNQGRYQVRNPLARLSFPRVRTGANGNYEPHSVADGLAVFIWHNHDGIRDRLLADIETYDDDLAISEADKPARLREADAAILAAQRYEEACIVFAQSQGVTVKRRETPVIVLLGIERADASSLDLQPSAVEDGAPESAADEFEDDDGEDEFG